MVDVSFRRHERLASFADYNFHPSPATKAKFDEEMKLLNKHEECKLYLALIIFVIVNGVGIYYYWNDGNRKTLD